MLANTSNLTKAELMYMPVNQKINEKEIISFFIKSYLECFKTNQIPSPAKIINTEWNMKDCWILVVACSDTESTSGSVVVKNGLSALRYLKLVEGKNSEPLRKIENMIMEKASMVSKILRLGLLLKVLTINNNIIISVGIINPNPPKLVIK